MKKAVAVTSALALLCCLAAPVAAAEGAFGPESGDLSLVPQVTLIGMEDTTTLATYTQFGYYFTPKFELSAMALFAGSWSDNGDFLLSGFFPTGYFHFNFSSRQRFVPHLGGGPGIIQISTDYGGNSNDDSAFAFTLLGGFDIYVTYDSAIRIDCKYTRWEIDSESTDQISLVLGANLLF